MTNKICFVLILSLLSIVVSAQVITVTGNVTDSDKVPLLGVSVLIKGTTKGVATDFDGNFSIEANKGDILEFSYVGYTTKTIKVTSNKVSVVLEFEAQALEDVVVVGYGTMRKSDLTGAVASVKAEDAIKNTPVSNVSEALQGRMAGVSIAGGGDPSSTASIRVRGVSSVSADTGPLVVIDGFIGGSLKNINPNDIQSVEVLKDASSTAVYGSRGANGVILITTKKAKMDKVNIDINSFINVKTVLAKPKLLSAADFAELVNQYHMEYNSDPTATNYYYTEEDIQNFRKGIGAYNYIDHIFNEPGFSKNTDVSISGRSGKTSYLTSLRYEDTDGIIKGSQYSQYNWRLKLDAELKDWMDIGFNIWGDYSESSGPRMHQYNGLLLSAINMAPTVLPKDSDDEYNNKFLISQGPTYNPMGHIWELDSKNVRLNNRLQGYINFKIIEGLTFRPQVGITFSNMLSRQANNSKSYSATFGKNPKTSASANSSWVTNVLSTNTLNYTKEFNRDHRINATGVYEQSLGTSYLHKGEAYDLSFPEALGYNALDYADLFRTSSFSGKTAITSFLARINYVFKDRYMFTASYRADGSAALAEKWDYFPSVALAWDIKRENFLQSVDWLSQFKLRWGYGSVGNQAVEMYRIFSKMRPETSSDGTTVYVLDRPASKNLRWERNEQWNIGVDLGLFNNQITISAEVYNKLTKDVLLNLKQPSHVGYTTLLQNAGEIRNTGFEVTIGATPIREEDFVWQTDLTLSHNKGIFQKIPTPTKDQTQGDSYENQIFRMIEGEKLGSFYGYTYDGVWKSYEVNQPSGVIGKENKTNAEVYQVVPGEGKYVDFNKDGIIDENDMRIIGNGQPTFNWGWNNSITYRNIDFSVFVIGYHGFDIYNVTAQTQFAQAGQTDKLTPNPAWLNRWTPQDEETDIPGFVNTGGRNQSVYSSRFVEKGDFIKIKSVTLGYNLPSQFCEQIGLNRLRLYTSVQNPFLITRYSGLDPEAALGTPLTQGADWGAYPNGRNYIFGINLSF